MTTPRDVEVRLEPRDEAAELCPWCGGIIMLQTDARGADPTEWPLEPKCWIGCSNDDCPVRPETAAFDTEEEAHEAWNHRAAPPPELPSTAPGPDPLERLGKLAEEVRDMAARVAAPASPLLAEMARVLRWLMNAATEAAEDIHAMNCDSEECCAECRALSGHCDEPDLQARALLQRYDDSTPSAATGGRGVADPVKERG